MVQEILVIMGLLRIGVIRENVRAGLYVQAPSRPKIPEPLLINFHCGHPVAGLLPQTQTWHNRL